MAKENLVRIWVPKTVKENLEEQRRAIAEDMKKQYGLKEITVPTTLASQVLMANKFGRKPHYKVTKIGQDKGILELIY